MPPDARAERSYERSCSLTMTLRPSAASEVMIDSPDPTSEEYGDHVGAYNTVGAEGSRPRRAWMAALSSEPSTRQSTFGYPIRAAVGLSGSTSPASAYRISRSRLGNISRSNVATTGAMCVGASRPYLPATPWNRWMRRVCRGNHVMFQKS